MDGLKRINTESSKMKSTKKITNKKLKYSDLDITENKIKHISNINVVKTKKKNSNNFTKSRTSFNKKIDNSPRIKSNQINKKDVTNNSTLLVSVNSGKQVCVNNMKRIVSNRMDMSMTGEIKSLDNNIIDKDANNSLILRSQFNSIK